MGNSRNKQFFSVALRATVSPVMKSGPLRSILLGTQSLFLQRIHTVNATHLLVT